MDVRSVLDDVPPDWEGFFGCPDICIAVLDGPVDLDHPCFTGADVTRIDTLVQDPPGYGAMSRHGTHVASLLFGQPGSPVVGLAPRCRGLILPVFRDGEETRVSQLDLARAVERAVLEGAHVINISGGEHALDGRADELLGRALRLCDDNGVLVVSAIGNDGREVLQVPAAVPSVIAVGAADGDRKPLATNNWADAYMVNGLLAPGEHIVGATPGGDRKAMTGSSFATPVVSGVAALLRCQQFRGGSDGNPRNVVRALLDSALPCLPGVDEGRQPPTRHLNTRGAIDLIEMGRKDAVTTISQGITSDSAPEPASVESRSAPAHDQAGVAAAGEAVDAIDQKGQVATTAVQAESGPEHQAAGGGTSPPSVRAASVRAEGGVAPSSCGCGTTVGRPLIYAIGTVGIDFRTEARRDSFKSQMDTVPVQNPDGSGDTMFLDPNPYDPFQLADYLKRNPWASDKVTWTLNIERTPVYALEAEASFAMDWGEPVLPPEWDRKAATVDNLAGVAEEMSYFPPVSHVYRQFRDAIVGQANKDKAGKSYISRVSIPGLLTDRTVRLFSGLCVPVVEVKSRGIHTWNETALVDAVVTDVQKDARVKAAAESQPVDEDFMRQTVRALLDKIYYQFRNLGQSPGDRALNFAGTNAFTMTGAIKEGLLSGSYVPGVNTNFYVLDTIAVAKSPYDRVDSECWDVTATFFDPENDRRARVSYLFTIDVGDELPVSLAPAHRFLGGV